jgi:hypothetical protein
VQRNNDYALLGLDFWALVRFVSEQKGYSKGDTILSFSGDEISGLLKTADIAATDELIDKVSAYFSFRSEILVRHFKPMLMDVDTAKSEFEKLLPIHRQNDFKCKLPLNKQKGKMKQVAFFTAIVNILTEKTLRQSPLFSDREHLLFDDDPRNLVYIKNAFRELIGSSSRRFDGAFPATVNPIAIWEIKEYYYATTFGSRIADGVYETQLDGYEFKAIEDLNGIHVDHIFFLDAYHAWWNQGKSYLCRIVDALHMGLVDEVIVGREALTRWPELLENYIEQLQDIFED